jgi:hypothetical protein
MENPMTKRLLKSTLVILSLSLVLGYGSKAFTQSLQPDIVATLNGEPIFLSELEQNVAFQVYRLQGNIYSLLKRETEELVNQKLDRRSLSKRSERR